MPTCGVSCVLVEWEIIYAAGGAALRPAEASAADYEAKPAVPTARQAGRLEDRDRSWETHMNHDRIEGRWKQIKGKVKEQWGKLTEDDLDIIAGRRDQLLGRIQQRHGIAKDEADRQVRSWERRNEKLD
jgi:uncharacterized protein YjbJ (UPF0337 family)